MKRLIVVLALALVGCGHDARPADVEPSATHVATQTVHTPGRMEQVLSERGVRYGTHYDVIALSALVCVSMQDGFSVMDIAGTIVDRGYTLTEAGYIIGAAVGTDCPQYNFVLTEFGKQFK